MPLDSPSHPHTKLLVRKIPMPTQDFILIGIGLLSVLLYTVLLVVGSIPSFALLLLPILWLVYWTKNGRLNFSTPLDFPVIGLLIVAALGVFISTDLDKFLPKLGGLIIGVSTYFTIVNFLRYRQRLNLLIFLLLFLAFAISLLTLFGTDWPQGGFGFINQIYAFLPEIPIISERLGINKNTMGGALTFFPPLLLSLLWDNDAFSRFKSRYASLSKLPDSLYKGMVLSELLVVLFAVLLTQSRGAWLACAAGVFLFCILKNKRFLWVIPLLLGVFLFILFRYADGSLIQMLSFLDTSQEATLPIRLDVWQKALIIVQNFSITGISLGSFGEIYSAYFSSIAFPFETDVIFHPHNTLLSVAVEVGFPGLILYASLLGSFAAMSWKTYKLTRSINRVLILGLACGAAAFFVFGLFDAFTLGRNLEIIIWIFLGVIVALFVHEDALNSTRASQEAAESESTLMKFDPVMFAQKIKLFLLIIFVWILVVLFSLSWVNLCIIAAFLIALFLGIAFGIYQTTLFSRAV